MSGFTPDTRQIIKGRDGARCIRCGTAAAQIHHRRPRGMGGTRRPESNEPANGVCFCLNCHTNVERLDRKTAYAFGYLVPQEIDPATVPILWHRQWVLLDNCGNYTITERPDSFREYAWSTTCA